MTMKKIISALLLVAFTTTTNVTYSQDLPEITTPEGEADPGEAIAPMKTGQKAPFSGVLLSPKAVASIVAKLKSVDKMKQLAAAEAKETAEEVCKNEKNLLTIRTDTDKEILNARIESNKQVIGIYEKKLQDVTESQSNPSLLVGLGAAGGIIASVLTVLAVSQAMK